MFNLSPKLGEFLLKVTRMADMDMALRKVFHEYLDLKLAEINKEIDKFEGKWKMSFNEFLERNKKNEIGNDIFSYEIEREFWEWERLDTLKKYNEELRIQWI
ncbi:MAG: hypothetical protein V1872_06050 [bacterium]